MKSSPFLFLFSSLILLSVNILLAQQPVSFHISSESELPFEKIYALQPTQYGHLALGTEDGVYSFDGAEFKKLNIPSNDEIIGLFLNQDSSVYATSLTNIIYEVGKDSLHPIIDWSNHTKGYLRYVKRENQLYLSSSNGFLFSYHLNTSQLDSTKLSSYRVYPIQSKLQRLIILAYEGNLGQLVDFDQQENKVLHKISIEQNIDQFNLLDFKNKSYFLSNGSNSVESYLSELTTQMKLKRILSFNDSIPRNRYRSLSNEETLLIFSDNGIEVLDQTFSIKGHLLKDKTVTGAYLNEASLWVSTLNSGLFYFPNYKAQLFNHENSNLDNNNLNQITSFNGQLLFTNRYGELYTSKSPSSFQKLTHNTKRKEANFGFKQSLFSNELIYQTSDSSYQLSKVNHGFTISSSPASIGSKDRSISSFFEIYSAHNGAFIVNYDKGFQEVQKVLSEQFIQNHLTKEGRIQLTAMRSNKNIFDKSNHTIWVATNRYLLKFKKQQVDTVLVHKENIVAQELKLINGDLYFSTQYYIAIIPNGSSTPKILFKTKASSINSFTLHEDGLIVCTKKGVHLLNNSYKLLFSLNTNHGLPSNNILGATLLNNTLYTTSKLGLGKLPLNNLLDTNYLVKVEIDALLVNGQKIDLSRNSLQFSHLENDIEFSLKGIDLVNFKNRRYWYRLKNKDPWQLATAPKNIRFPNLQSGDYAFSAYLEGRNGIQSSKISVPFSIALPIWKRWWFITLFFLFIFTLIAIYFKQRIREIKKNKDLSNKLIRSEIDGLKSQMNPHFIFNALNSIQDLIITEDIAQSNYYLGKFARLLRMVLDYSSQEQIKIDDEVTLLKTYLELESLRFKGALNAEIQVLNNEINTFLIPPFIIQPYIENAIKHGLLHSQKQKKELSVLFSQSSSAILCTIEDNGIGRTASNKINQRREKYHQSFATKAIEKRVDLINETLKHKIQIQTIDLPEGTRVEIYFAIQ